MANKSAIKGTRRSPSQWRSILAEYHGSGLSGEAFCRQKVISRSNFYRWWNLLTGSDAGSAISKPATAAFLDLGALTPPTKNKASLDLSLPFFDETQVPIEVIELAAPETAGLAPEDFEVIGHKDSFRLAQRPGSYVVLKYQRPVIKLKAIETIVCAAASIGVIEGRRADVSFIAGLLIDKFAYHLPFYRQHQRLTDAGITVSRPWLTQIGQQGIALLEPIYEA